jgi:alcohol dehydrogenase class IV
MTNGVLLPHGMRFNLEAVAPQYARLSRALGISDEPDDRLCAEKLVASIENLVVKIQLPTTLRELGVPELSESILAELVDLAASDPAIMFNPREATNEDLLDLLQRAY